MPARPREPHTDGRALDKPITVHVCEHHASAPSYQLDIGWLSTLPASDHAAGRTFGRGTTELRDCSRE